MKRRPTICLGERIPSELAVIFRSHGFEVLMVEDDPALANQDDRERLAKLYQVNGILITQNALLYDALKRSRPKVPHAGIVIVPSAQPPEITRRLAHVIARYYRAATTSSPFGGRNRLLYPSSDGLRVLDTTTDIGNRDGLLFPWEWWEEDDQRQGDR
jgi:hypothetical protein